ncbi:MAG: VCBS repeat-containing protein [Acidobacteria bacterium]|nr:VCBS repeat-containing protein [Acidobacteriota bacterium]
MNTSQTFFKRHFIFMQLILIAFISISAVKAQTSSVDLSFNAIPEKNSTSTANFTLQPDNKIIVFGNFQVVNGAVRSQIARLNPDGSLDATFNCATCNFNISNALLQPDGKIVVSGSTNNLIPVVYRLNADGSRDASFTSPIATVMGSAFVNTIQPDGKILVTHSGYIGGFFFAELYRLNTDGTVDTTFTRISVGSGRLVRTYPVKISVAPDGKILVATNTTSASNTAGDIRRYNANGTADSTFEPPNIVGADGFPGFNRSLINDFDIQSDRSIVIVGRFVSVNAVSRLNVAKLLPTGNVDLSFNSSNIGQANRVRILPDGKVLISSSNQFYRLNTDGSLDISFTSPTNITLINNWMFDSAGRIFLYGVFLENGVSVSKFARLNQNGSIESSFTVTFGVVASTTAIAVQADGKVVFAGDFIRVNGVPRVSIARVNADGNLDTTFNSGTGFNGTVSKILIQSDGKILVVGTFSNYNGTPRAGIARLNADGSLDTNFNPINSSNTFLTVNTIALQSDGKILIGGVFNSVGGQTRTGIARLNADGSLDASFNPTFGNAAIQSILVQSDGKIMVGGTFSGVNGFSRTNLARLNTDGSLDSSFNAANNSIITFGVRQIEVQTDERYLILTNKTIVRLNSSGATDSTFTSPTFLSPENTINQFLVQPDDSILIGGSFSQINNVPRLNFARLRPDGTLDIGFFPSGANGAVRTIVRQADGRILVGGDFSIIGDVTRLSVARLNIIPVRAPFTLFDFDGDGKADISVFRPSNGYWYRINSSSGQWSSILFGVSSDKIVPADYDGDGRTDLAVYRNGTWYIQQSTAGFTGVSFGDANDIPVPADYDGDGRADIAVFRPSNGVWYIMRSSLGFLGIQFGQNDDKPTLGDFDGDRKSDIAVFRPSNGFWYRINSSTGQWNSIPFGMANDLVVPADYDGDGKTDIAVFRPSNGVWYLQRNTAGYTGVLFGISEDSPLPNAFVR